MSKPSALTQSQCENIVKFRDDSKMKWSEIAAIMSVSERTCGRAYKYAKQEQVAEKPKSKSKLPKVAKQEVVQPKEVEKYDAMISGNTICIINRTTSAAQYIKSDNEHFDTISKIVAENILERDEETKYAAFAKCFKLADKKSAVEKFVNGRITIDPDGKVVDSGGIELPEKLIKKIIDISFESNTTHKESGILKFTNLLLENPSNRAVRELYGFIAAKDIEINEDGMVVCFKKVRGTYYDIHSNTMFNGVGETLRVPRNSVNEDSSVTCSYGLHVCSKSYLSHFGNGSDDRVLKVLVNPADFVSIPRDYNDAKARVCGYYVAEDITHKF